MLYCIELLKLTISLLPFSVASYFVNILAVILESIYLFVIWQAYMSQYLNNITNSVI